MRGLTIIIADVSPVRFRAALSVAASQAALGGKVRIFLSGEAVDLIRMPVNGWDDDDYAAIGQPDLVTLYAEALEGGVGFTVCQTGMALCRATMADFDSRIEAGGMVSLLATLGDDHLLTF
jgi:predicted peroxiredoxin